MINHLDLHKILEKQNPNLYQKLKKYKIIFILEKLLKINDFNKIINRHHHQDGIEFVQAVLKEKKISWEISGHQKIVEKKNYIFVANHSSGGVDSLVFLSGVAEIFSKQFLSPKILANKILQDIKPMADLFLPINVFSVFNKKQFIEIKNHLTNNHQPLLLFPNGAVSRKNNNRMVENFWKKSYLNFALASKRDIVPTTIFIQNSKLFYWIAKFRKFVKIKTNIEMFLLPREFFAKNNQKIKIHFGTPITNQEMKKQVKDFGIQQTNIMIKDKIIDLLNQ